MYTPPHGSTRLEPSGSRALLLWGAVLMLSGIGIGAGGILLLGRHAPVPIGRELPDDPDRGRAPNLDFRPGPIVSQMVHELNLDPKQTRDVTAAYGTSLSAIHTLRKEMVVKLAAEHEKLRTQLRKTLTEEQFARWDQQYEQMRSRMMPDAPRPDQPPGREGPPPGNEGSPPPWRQGPPGWRPGDPLPPPSQDGPPPRGEGSEPPPPPHAGDGRPPE